MSQCVPSWDLDENPSQPRVALRAHSISNSITPHVPMLDYEVAELTWENGQLNMHGFGPPRVSTKHQSTWEKPRGNGTLESIVNQATTGLPHCIPTTCYDSTGQVFLPWLNHHHCHAGGATAASATVSMDAMVPCSNLARDQQSLHALESLQTGVVGSCSGNNTMDHKRDDVAEKRARVARVPVVPSQQDWSSMDNSFSGSATFGRDSCQVTLDTCEKELGACGLTSTSTGSPENTCSGQQGTKATTADEYDSVCHGRHKREKINHERKKKTSGKSSVPTRRSRAADIHNQSERKRRDKINQRMKTLQKLVPNSSKTDKASMLDEVIEYMKQLQAQVSMMNRMNMSPMLYPMTLQQPIQLSMMAATTQMGIGGMGLGGVMDLNSIGRPNLAGISPMLHPATFMPFSSWEGSGDRLSAPTAMVSDPMSAFLACQSQPMTMDAYSRMAALYQQFNQMQQQASKK